MSQTTCGDYDSALTIGFDCHFDAEGYWNMKNNWLATNKTVESLATAIESTCRKVGLVGWTSQDFDLVDFNLVASEWIQRSQYDYV